ncbi:SDR family NAD(P)-dependent oxidoreductase [Oryzibacter oryziterrae]|uniref:SDR family NAD(P)-dependent oxidoreductase n=1 Tax=Oryzibacter oryziterrae TaxID=2766474 RepID=UPI001F4698A0|nr:SDR family NAD(P)-dependent oxidoreductase [Oryzibacter oryziterrae]
MTEATDKRIAVVTGASRGIGFATAVALAKAGHHIVAVARTQGGLEELDDAITAVGGSATLVPLDLTQGDKIDQLGAALDQRFGRVDVLVGNAGVLGGLSPVGHIPLHKWDQAFAINVTANYRLIRSLDPLLRASSAARCVFVSSAASWKDRPFWGVYAATKAALNSLVLAYAAEMVNFTVTANLLNPGPLRTRMRAQAMPGEDPETLKTPEDLAPHIVAMVAPEESRTGALYDFPTQTWMKLQPPQ